MTRKAAQTGPGAMVLVAIEQAFPDGKRIIDDDLATPILPLSFRINVWISTRVRDWLIRKTEEKVPGLWGGIMSRKRYIDDIVSEAADGQSGLGIPLSDEGQRLDRVVHRVDGLEVPGGDEPGT